MIQRTQHQDDIGAGVGTLKVASISYFAACERMRLLTLGGGLSLDHVVGDRIDEMDFVSLTGEPQRMDARRSTNVEDDRRRLYQSPFDQFPRTDLFEFTCTGRKTFGLVDLPIVIEHLGRQ